MISSGHNLARSHTISDHDVVEVNDEPITCLTVPGLDRSGRSKARSANKKYVFSVRGHRMRRMVIDRWQNKRVDAILGSEDAAQMRGGSIEVPVVRLSLM